MASSFMYRGPREAYRRVATDAAILGSDPAKLGKMCYDEFISALGRAILQHERANPSESSRALVYALSCLAGLRFGLDKDNPLAGAFETMFDAAEAAVRQSILSFNPAPLMRVRADFGDIRNLMFPNME